MIKSHVSIFIVTLIALASSVPASAGSYTDFNSFSLGNVNNQGGWSMQGGYDVQVVNVGPGDNALRISSNVTSGAFGDQTFSASSGEWAGESMVDTDGNGIVDTATTNFNTFLASFDFWVIDPNEGQFMSISADDGTGRRMSWLGLENTGSGVELQAYDYDSNINNFVFSSLTTVAFDTRHTIGIEILFADGHANDVYNVYLDSNLIHTGTSWEEYFWDYQPSNTPLPPAVDRLLFREGGTADPATGENRGFFIDNVSVQGLATPVPVPAAAGLGFLGLALVGLARRIRAH